MFIQHPMDCGRGYEDDETFERHAMQLRQLAAELRATNPERAAACALGADVLESLVEPVTSWPSS